MNGPAPLTTRQSNIRPLNGQIFNKPGVQYTEDLYIYQVNFGSLAAGATANQQNVLIQADSHFEWFASTYYAFLDGSTPPYPDNTFINVAIQIADSGSGRQLFSGPVPITSIAGPGREPAYLPVPRIFMSKSQITINAINNDSTNKYDNIQLSLIGRKIFESGAGGFPY